MEKVSGRMLVLPKLDDLTHFLNWLIKHFILALHSLKYVNQSVWHNYELYHHQVSNPIDKAGYG